MNVTLFLEGEEEVGSPTIERTVGEYRSLLEADVMYHPDGEIWEDGQSHVALGDRGLVFGQIDIRAANRDLHSGHYCGPVPNAARELVRLCESMIADHHRPRGAQPALLRRGGGQRAARAR
jgi:acetylornithine deacetylase/succinyl-diaminopimelate desuccinylase-like protein